MLLKNATYLTRQPHVSTMKTGFRLLTALVFLCLLMATPAFCQDATYQDQWQQMSAPSAELWDYSDEGVSDPAMADPNPSTVMVGSSVTEMAYDATYSDSQAYMTFSGPTGTVSTSGYVDPYARNEAALAWDWENPNEVEYNVTTEHTYWYYNEEPQQDCMPSRICQAQVSYNAFRPFGFWSFIRRIFFFVSRRRVVLHSYKRDFSGDYVPTCHSVCTYPIWRPVGVNALYIECQTTYDVYKRECLGYIYFCKNRRTPGRCRN